MSLKTETLSLLFVEYLPEKEKVEPGIFYYAKEFDVSAHLCPCGCGGVVNLFYHRLDNGWGIDLQTLTITPSIYSYQWPCKSHYFITNGEVKWV